MQALRFGNLKSMPTLGRFAITLALLAVLPTGWLARANAVTSAAGTRLEPTLQDVSFRGITSPEGKPLDENTQVECKVYDPKKPESTAVIAHAIGVAGATEFNVAILNNQYTHETLNGCRCSMEIHGRVSSWDVTPYLLFKFYDGSTASVTFSKIKIGSAEGYKPKYDVMIDGL